MKIAVLSGKGGAGKTFVSVNLAAVAENSIYIDCDVEEPNGRLFFKPEEIKTTPVFVTFPIFDNEKCMGCRKCVDFCRFSALAYVKNKPIVFPEICHSCGGCVLMCPKKAISENKRQIGVVESGKYGDKLVVTGVMNPGEESGVPIIKAVMKQTYFDNNSTVVIDCPPGSACVVMESVSYADFCILVVEPTSFGLHNLKMVYELVSLLKKPCGVIINKASTPFSPLEQFCSEHKIPILLYINYKEELALWGANGQIAIEQNQEYHTMFSNLLNKIMKGDA